MIFFPLQSKNKILNNCTVTKKKQKKKQNWENIQNMLIMGKKLYQISSAVCIFS